MSCPALDLHGLMGQLTVVWGGGVGYFTLINWMFATATLCLILDPEALPGFEAALQVCRAAPILHYLASVVLVT